MGLFSRFEHKMEDAVEGAADKMASPPISPVQIAKKAAKQMRREAMVGAGKEYAPTLYTVLVNSDDDQRLFGYYPTLAGETETYLVSKAQEDGLSLDGTPLVRFVVDDSLRHGKFDVIAEAVASPIVEQLRQEEFERYGIAPHRTSMPANRPHERRAAARGQAVRAGASRAGAAALHPDAPPAAAAAGTSAALGAGAYDAQAIRAGYANSSFEFGERAQAPARKPPLPYVPEDQIDRSIDYGEYTFNSEDFEGYDERRRAQAGAGVGGEQQDADSAPQPRASHTVSFTAGNSTKLPDRHAVRARLVNTSYNRTYDLAGTRVAIGRATDNDIVVQDISASRNHAQMVFTPQGAWTITDLGSTNGTVVNGQRIAQHILRNGDQIVIGKTAFQFIVG